MSGCSPNPTNGKSDCDGYDDSIRIMFYEWFAALERMPTPTECVKYLWDHKKGVPIRGKNAKYKEYRFKMVEGKKPTAPSADTFRGTTKWFNWK